MKNKKKSRFIIFSAIFLFFSFVVQAAPEGVGHSTEKCLQGSASISLLPLRIRLQNNLSTCRTDEPVTFGVPLGYFEDIRDLDSLDLKCNGVSVPVQKRATARWAGSPNDGARPLQWLLLDFQASIPAGEYKDYILCSAPSSSYDSPLQIIADTAESFAVDTGAAVFRLSKQNFKLFDQVILAEGKTYGPCEGIRFGDFQTGAVELRVEEQGKERIGISIKGTLSNGLEYTLKLDFYKGKSYVRGRFRLENLNTIQTDGGGQPQCNDYGSSGSASFDDLSLVIAGNGASLCLVPAGENGAAGTTSLNFVSEVSVVQESSGRSGWDHLLTEHPRMQSGTSKRSSTIRIDGIEGDGPGRFGGWLDAYGVTIAVKDCSENFPKAFRASDDNLELGLFPGEYSMDHEFRAGEFKTHSFLIYYHEDDQADQCETANAFLKPLKPEIAADYLMETRSLGLMAPRRQEDSMTQDYEDYIDYMLEPSPDWSGEEYPWPTLLASINNFNHYGYVDYGDVPTDFECWSETAAAPYNLKYDALKGMYFAWLRTNDPAWGRLAEAGVVHYADFDILHSEVRGKHADRLWFQGGAYGHGYHDERGNANPHRNYMNPHPSMSFAVPGMILHYFLTGDSLVGDAALELAENMYWRITHSGYWESGPCGSILRDCDPEADECHGWSEFFWGRLGGNAFKSFLSAYMTTGDDDYIEILERCCEYMVCCDTQVDSINDCDRYHFKCTFLSYLCEYILYRRLTGYPDDDNALYVLGSSIDYMINVLWDHDAEQFRMCYETAELYDFHDNWLVAVADVLAGAALIFNDETIFTDYAVPVFLDGTANPFCPGCDFSYNSAKEFVNGVGFGHVFLYAYDYYSPPAFTGVRLEMPSTQFSPGDQCWLNAVLSNEGPELNDVPLFVILDVFGEYWFWNDWKQEPDYGRVDLPAGASVTITIIDPFQWPDTGSDELDGIVFWSGMTDQDLSEILGGIEGIGSWEFGYGP